MTVLPSLFLSHGAPMLALEESPAQRFLLEFGARIPRPRAIVAVSAHHDAPVAEVTASALPPTIHDFRGFPQALYELRYAAPGDPQLASRIVSMLRAAGTEAQVDETRGLDHGAWVPLMLIYPEADVPVVQLSINMERSPRHHLELGQALSSLRNDGVLILGSGSATHNLREFFAGQYAADAMSPDWVTTFADWLSEQVERGNTDEVLNAVDEGPHGHRNHPTMDHIHPLFFAMGAGAPLTSGTRVHRSTTYGVLAMDAYAFGTTSRFERT